VNVQKISAVNLVVAVCLPLSRSIGTCSAWSSSTGTKMAISSLRTKDGKDPILNLAI